MKTLTSLFMTLLFCFGCSQSKDMYPIDVVKIDPITPPMDMTSTVDSGIKCGARELKTDEGCVPCSVIVPDDYPTINQAVGKGDVVCVRDGVYKEDVFIKTPMTLQGQGFTSVLEGNILYKDVPYLAVKNIKASSIKSDGTLSLERRFQQLYIYKVLFFSTLCVSHDSNYGTVQIDIDGSVCKNNNIGIVINRNSGALDTQNTQVEIKNNEFSNNSNIMLNINSNPSKPNTTILINIFNNVFNYSTTSITQQTFLEKGYTQEPKTYIVNNTFIPTAITATGGVLQRSDYIENFPIHLLYNLYKGNLEITARFISAKYGNIQTEDRFFVDPSKNNYHLTKNSPAIDYIITYPYPYEPLKKDKDGNKRPINGLGTMPETFPAYFDVGAYEYDPKDTK